MADTFSQADTGVESDRGVPAGTPRWQKVVAMLGVLVVLWVGNDTYKVIDGDFGGGGDGGGGGHGPGQEAPVENQDQPSDTDNGGGHTPGPPEGGH